MRNKKHMKNCGLHIVLLLLGIAVIAGCSQDKRFTVEGAVKDAAGDTLYLEHRALSGVVLLDSLLLKEGGALPLSSAGTCESRVLSVASG